MPTMFFGIGALTPARRPQLVLAFFLWLLSASGCEATQESGDWGRPLAAYRDRMLAESSEAASAAGRRPAPVARPVASQANLPERQSLMTQPAVASQPAAEDVLTQIPDPEDAPRVFEERLRRLREERSQDPRVVTNYANTVKYALDLLQFMYAGEQSKVRLSLAECVQRALENNYTIRIEAYNPAIAQTRIIEAEAAFDATFFLDTSYFQRDDPQVQPTTPGQGNVRSYGGGFRQLLPTGMQASIALRQQRTAVDFQDETINIFDRYSSNFVADIRQPLLRGFGLDFNRAQINIAKMDRRIAHHQFQQQVRDTLLNVETAYWRLAQARRNVAILAESVAQNGVTYQDLLKRKDLDATPVELNNALSRYQSRYVQYLETVKLVRDAEDALKNLLNDPQLKLSQRIELIPTEVPFILPMALDQFAEVRTALDARTEITQAKLTIDKTRIQTMVAKNQTLPQLDVTFQYEVKGIGTNAGASFDQLTSDRYRSFTVGATFSYPLGNRGPRAAEQRARMQESQAIVNLHRVTDTVVQEVNNAVRTLLVRYTQVPPQFEAVMASERNLRALQARAQKIDPSFLETELNTVEQLANTRRALLQVIVDYNVGVVELERSKGTLLQYNNIAVTDEPPRK